MKNTKRVAEELIDTYLEASQPTSFPQLLRHLEKIQQEVNNAKASLKKYEANPERAAPQLDNVKNSIRAIMTSVGVLSRKLNLR